LTGRHLDHHATGLSKSREKLSVPVAGGGVLASGGLYNGASSGATEQEFASNHTDGSMAGSPPSPAPTPSQGDGRLQFYNQSSAYFADTAASRTSHPGRADVTPAPRTPRFGTSSGRAETSRRSLGIENTYSHNLQRVGRAMAPASGNLPPLRERPARSRPGTLSYARSGGGSASPAGRQVAVGGCGASTLALHVREVSPLRPSKGAMLRLKRGMPWKNLLGYSCAAARRNL